MIGGNINVSVPTDRTKELMENLAKLATLDVLVGIPEEKSSRPGEQITNAELAFIHSKGIRSKSMRDEMDASMAEGKSYTKAHEMYIQEHGSPLWHSPPRPIIEPSIEDPENREQIMAELNKVPGHVMDGDMDAAMRDLASAGMVAQNVVRDWFTNPKNGWAPNSPITIDGSKPDKDGKQFIKGKGSERPLIDTGELRKSVGYVIREKE